ncbi:MAG: sugar ABC transporter ATP-binding protein, partial [Actinobacteria bacterium]|nr:sugar ABC transporter ATP-binding protein [Actinomycetota bacterium]
MLGQQGAQDRPILRIRGLCKSFGRTNALVDIDLDIAPASIHALIGG